MTTPDPRFARYAEESRTILDAARAAARRKDAFGVVGEDEQDVSLIFHAMLNLYMREEAARPSAPFTIAANGVNLVVCGWHTPGHVDERGAPVALFLPAGANYSIPKAALPVAIVLPMGRENDMAKTFPRIG